MDWEPKQQDLGGLGFAGICRETYRVLLTILPNTKGGPGAAILTALLLAHATAIRGFVSCFYTDDGCNLARLVAGILVEAIFMLLLLLLSFICTAAYVFRVASLYCNDGDSDAADRIIRDLPGAPFTLLLLMCIHVFPFANLYALFCALSSFVLLQLEDVDKVVVLPLEMLASAAFVSVLSHPACVLAVLEDAVLFGAVGKSAKLLVGKFWAAAAVFVPLDACFVALHISFVALVLDDALGLGLGFQVAAGAAIAVALWAVVVATLVAQPVVYLVCKKHHHEVVHKFDRKSSTRSESTSGSPSKRKRRGATALEYSADPCNFAVPGRHAVLPSTDY